MVGYNEYNWDEINQVVDDFDDRSFRQANLDCDFPGSKVFHLCNGGEDNSMVGDEGPLIRMAVQDEPLSNICIIIHEL